MARFEFVTDWHFEAPIEAVFDALTDSLRWPEWWRGVVDVEEREAGDEGGIGRVRDHHVIRVKRRGLGQAFPCRDGHRERQE